MPAPIIGPAVLAQFKDMSEGMMPDTVTIERYGAPTVGTGGAVSYGAPTTETTMGRVSMPSVSQSEREAERYGQMVQDDTAEITVPMGTLVNPTDTLVVLSARHGTETRYTVEEVVPLGSHSVDRKILVKPVRS